MSRDPSPARGARVSPSEYDVVVVGAGPAGSTLALRMARRGFRVALLDKKGFPRHKPCGEFMSPECLCLLDELGLRDEVVRLGARRVGGMRLHGYGRRSQGSYGTVGMAPAPFDHGYAVRRERFDDVLLRAACAEPGVEFFPRHRVVGLLRDAGGPVTGVEALDAGGRPLALRAPFTVGADGVRSRVARALGVQREIRWLRKFALVTRFADAGVGAGIGERRDADDGGVNEYAEVHFFPGGFFAAAPVDGSLLSLNLVLDREELSRRVGSWDAFLWERLEQAPLLRDKLGTARRVDPIRGTGPLAFTTKRQVFDGAALVGDACGYVDPVTGEGVFFALRGAALLAEPLARALHTGCYDATALADYVRGRRREVAPRLAFARLLQRGMRHPAVVRSLLRLFEARPGLSDLLVSVTGDYAPLRELLRPRTWLAARRVAQPGAAS